MMNHSKRPFVSRWITNQRGAAALISIVVVMALVVLVVTSVAMAGLSTLEHGFATQVSTDVILADEVCAEEAILRLQRDSAYTGGTLVVGDATCTIAVSGAGGTRTIDVEGVEQDFTRRLQTDITLSGSTANITSWQELD